MTATLLELKPIYKKDTKGKTRVINYYVDRNAFWAVHGLLDGKQITDKKTYCEGKNIGRANETTPEEQALAEATSKRQKKLDTGYFENIKDIGNLAYFDPMLAHKWEDYKKNITQETDIYVQPKLDGMRCIARWENGKVVCRSRKGKEIIPIVRIIQELEEKLPYDMILDGELYNHELKADFNKIISLVKKTKPTDEDIKECGEKIQYHIYDMFDVSNPDLSFLDRIQKITRTIFATGSSDCLGAVFTVGVNEPILEEKFTKINEQYGHCLESGYEGQIIRFDKPYENKRSKFLLKRKEFLDDEFEIIGVEEGKGKRAGQVGALVMLTKDGKEFNGNVKGTDAFRKDLLANTQDLVGEKAHVRFFEYTPDGIPRFPVVHNIRDYE